MAVARIGIWLVGSGDWVAIGNAGKQNKSFQPVFNPSVALNVIRGVKLLSKAPS